jgi:hypothetical protein
MKKLSLILILLFFCNLYSEAQKVVIKGNAKSYAGDVLTLKCYEDLITYKEKVLADCKVAENGDFRFNLNLSETLMSFIHLNVFKGILFIEPNKEYEIVLPKKVSKLPEDELNPFFEESEFFIRQLNGGDIELTELIKSFNRQFDNHTNRYFQNFKGKLNKSIADSIIMAIENNFTAVKNPYFTDYKNYNYFSLRLMAYDRNTEKMISEAFAKRPILYRNPAYMDFFNQLFSNYLSVYSKTEEGKMMDYFIVKEKSLKNIKACLSQSSNLQDEKLQEIIICKSLFENFYKDDYPKESIICVLDSIQKTSKSAENIMIASNIIEKITALLPSYPAPDFVLPGKDGKMYALTESSGKFVYLNFINPQSYTCQQELEVLKKLANKNFEMLEIISVCVSSNADEMKKLINEKGYNWKFLYYKKDIDLLKKYNVRVFPTYYLINPESKLIMSPAFPPTEPSFEARYYDILKAWKQEKESKKTKGLQH